MNKKGKKKKGTSPIDQILDDIKKDLEGYTPYSGNQAKEYPFPIWIEIVGTSKKDKRGISEKIQDLFETHEMGNMISILKVKDEEEDENGKNQDDMLPTKDIEAKSLKHFYLDWINNEVNNIDRFFYGEEEDVSKVVVSENGLLNLILSLRQDIFEANANAKVASKDLKMASDGEIEASLVLKDIIQSEHFNSVDAITQMINKLAFNRQYCPICIFVRDSLNIDDKSMTSIQQFPPFSQDEIEQSLEDFESISYKVIDTGSTIDSVFIALKSCRELLIRQRNRGVIIDGKLEGTSGVIIPYSDENSDLYLDTDDDEYCY